MNLNRFFQLEKHNTTYKKEILAGITTFFTMSYIIFVNPAIVSETGMSYDGLFASTVIVSAVCTLLMSLFANSPYAVAPGMGTNTFVTYTMCIGLNFHWKEAMAVTFITGCIHLVLAMTGLRKEIVKAIPKSLKYATSAGIGLFIIYVGLKNAGLLSFILNPGQYTIGESGIVIGNSQAVPELIGIFTKTQFLSVLGLFVIIGLLMLEKKTGDSYGTFVTGVLIITFIGIPLGVTEINLLKPFDMSPVFHLKDVAFSFFGSPGLLSVFADPDKALSSILMIIILLMTNIVDSVSTIVGIGQLEDSLVFDQHDFRQFENVKGISSKLDRTLISDSASGILSSLIGTTGATTFIESVTGIAAGGKTGLTSLVVAILFLLCLPFSSFFAIIPSAASAPVLIAAGIYLMTLLKNVDWGRFDEAISCALVLAFIPLTYSVLNGVAIGFIAYILVRAIMGEWRKVHPLLYLIAAAFILIIILRTVFKV